MAASFAAPSVLVMTDTGLYSEDSGALGGGAM